MQRELQFRNYSPRAVQSYLAAINVMSRYFNASPEKITNNQLKDYLQVRAKQDEASPSTINQIISAFKILQVDVFGNSWNNFRIKQAQWVDKLKSALPATRYFHLVFTLPQALHKLFYVNQSCCYSLLLNAAIKSVKQVAGSKNGIGIGANVGGIALLHTWGQALTYHPHVHMLVPAGGLSEDGMEWIHANKKFFVPVKVLSKVFRGILCRQLEKVVLKGEIFLHENMQWRELKDQLYMKNWNVYVKPALAGSEKVLEYLGRYTHRVAIANERITQVTDQKVTFRVKDYKANSIIRKMELPVLEFLRRFLQHILPTGFYKIRYFGFMAQVNVGKLGKQVIALLEQYQLIPEFEGLSTMEIFHAIFGCGKNTCPVCHIGRLIPAHFKEPPS